MAGGRKNQGPKARPPIASYTDDYFVFPHIFWMIAIPFGFYLLFTATFTPDNALRYLPGHLGTFVNYMGRSHHNICISLCVFAVVAHCVEAAYAGKVSQDKCLTPLATAKWSFMTFLFGFASLSRLVSYDRLKTTGKQH
ncbi:transmembrane protein 254-like [Littorina saxatilis]|uniref:Transmembrane protein 254 n=1 Tax=Littorina saxatilis TaxID=31220 RepID=A0AAN9APX6_9CAEN